MKKRLIASLSLLERDYRPVERSLPRTTTSNMEPQAEPQAVAQAVPLEEPGRATGKLRQS